MIASIHPSTISGVVEVPPSKSAMQRACAAALIRKGVSVIRNPGNSEDDKAAIEIITQLGANVSFNDGQMIVHSNGICPVSNVLNCGESGLGARLFTPIAALSSERITITGKRSLLNRPMDFFDEIFPLLGVKAELTDGKLPVTVQGCLQPANIAIDGSISSQFLTGLLMAFSAAEAKNATITVNDLKSKPYIDLTLKVMKAFGLKTPSNKDYSEFYFDNSTVSNSPSDIHYTIEGDWSSAAFLLVAAAISGKMSVTGI